MVRILVLKNASEQYFVPSCSLAQFEACTGTRKVSHRKTVKRRAELWRFLASYRLLTVWGPEAALLLEAVGRRTAADMTLSV